MRIVFPKFTSALPKDAFIKVRSCGPSGRFIDVVFIGLAVFVILVILGCMVWQ